MATINGFIRSYGAAVRRAERAQQREARELAKRFKEQQKLEEILNAHQAVKDWENYVTTIQSVHRNCTEPVDWDNIKASRKPNEPEPEFRNERIAQRRLDSFRPSFFDKILGLSEKKISKLKEQVNQAKAKDVSENDTRYNRYKEELKDWEVLHRISEGIAKRQAESYRDALHYFDPFSDIGELGLQIAFSIDTNHIDIDLHVNSSEVIPDYELKLTSTGKLSKKAMPKTRFNELYQDHICSAAIRLAREVFSYLPIDYARINAMSKIVNGKNGQLEDQPILSVIFNPKTIDSLNLDKIDPSDSMQNFLHNMNFNKTRGFSIVPKVEFEK